MRTELQHTSHSNQKKVHFIMFNFSTLVCHTSQDSNDNNGNGNNNNCNNNTNDDGDGDGDGNDNKKMITIMVTIITIKITITIMKRIIVKIIITCKALINQSNPHMHVQKHIDNNCPLVLSYTLYLYLLNMFDAISVVLRVKQKSPLMIDGHQLKVTVMTPKATALAVSGPVDTDKVIMIIIVVKSYKTHASIGSLRQGNTESLLFLVMYCCIWFKHLGKIYLC